MAARRPKEAKYEHERPGDPLHVDVKKLGRVPDGGGHRCVGRAQGVRNRIATVKAGHATPTGLIE